VTINNAILVTDQDSILIGLWDGGHHSSRRLHANVLNRKGRLRPECRLTSPSPRSVEEKATTGLDPHCRLQLTDRGLSSQEGEGSRISSL